MSKSLDVLGSSRNILDEAKSVIKITPDFPEEVFPQGMIDILKTIKNPFGFPLDGLAIDMIAAASAAIGNSMVLEVNGSESSLNLFLVQVAPSGGGKTHDFKFSTGPLNMIDDNNHDEFKKKKARYEELLLNEKNINSKLPPAEKKITKLLEFDFRKEYGPEPQREILSVNGATLEGLMKTLKNSPRGILWSSQEIKQLLGDFNRYSGGKGSDEEKLLDFEHPTKTATTRAGGLEGASHSIVQKPFVTLLGGIQSGFVSQMFSDGRDVSGFAARFIFTWPVYGQRPHYSLQSPLTAEDMNKCKSKWARVIRTIYNTPYEPEGQDPELKTTLRLTPEAHQLFIDYLNVNVVDVSNAGASGVIASYIHKIEKKFIAIIGILHALHYGFDGNTSQAIPTKVEVGTVEKACTYMNYLTGMWLKVFKDFHFGITVQLSEGRAELYKVLPDEFTKSEVVKIAKAKGLMSRQSVYKFFKSDALEVYFKPVAGTDKYIKNYKIEEL